MGRRSFFLRLASRLEGPQTLGRGWRFWVGAAVVLALASAFIVLAFAHPRSAEIKSQYRHAAAM